MDVKSCTIFEQELGDNLSINGAILFKIATRAG
jgi:hypothetical protein